MLTWQLILFVAIGVNGNEIHKWSHLPRKNRSAVVLMLQDAGFLQSAKHHRGHHVGSKDSHYCVLTNVVNPVLDGIRFWRGLEWIIEQALGVQKRPEPETKALAGRVMIASELKRETG